MIEEAYVSYETAKILKEKGFDARCPMIYTADGEMLYTDVKHHNMYAVTNKQLEYYTDIIAPTLQMVMKWLREVHNLHIVVFRYDNSAFPYIWYIFAHNGDKPHKANSYEEACEAAIKYCLENLI